MLSLIYNEIIKLIKRKKTLILFVAFSLLVAFMMFGTYKDNENRKKYNSPEYRLQMLQENINNLKEMSKDTKIPEEDRKHFEKEILRNEEELKVLKETPKGQEIDWKQQLTLRINDIEENLKQEGMGSSYKESMKLQLEQYKLLLENNIKYDEEDLNAFNFLKILFEMLGAIFLVVGVIVFSADIVSGEYTPPTMKFLITQPVSRRKVLLSKFIAVVCTSAVIILSVELIAYVIMGLIFGFGNHNYPMLVGTRYEFDITALAGEGRPLKAVAGSSYIITRGVFLVRAFFIQMLFIAAAASFAFLLSTILKSSMISTSLGIVIAIVLTIFQNIPYVKKAAPYIFSTYGNSMSLMQGNLAVMMQAPIISTNIGILVLVVWTVLCYVIAHFVFTKRDILI